MIVQNLTEMVQNMKGINLDGTGCDNDSTKSVAGCYGVANIRNMKGMMQNVAGMAQNVGGRITNVTGMVP